MANELVHSSAGTILTQAEFEAIGLHVFNNQATGDLLYASSASQLTRLAKGAANTVLVMGASIPAWSATLAGLTLTSPTINGTIATTGLTMPAFTLGGHITGGDYSIGIGQIYRASATIGLYIDSRRTAANTGSGINLRTYNAANADTVRLSITSGVDTAVANWSSVTHTGMVLTSPTINGTIATTGLTLPAVTLGGSITASVAAFVARDVDNNYLAIRGGLVTSFSSTFWMYGGTHATKPGWIEVSTGNAALNADTIRLTLSGGVATAVATWSNITHTGMVMSDHLTLYITDTDGATEGDIWYDASENKLKFYNGAAVETITSAA